MEGRFQLAPMTGDVLLVTALVLMTPAIFILVLVAAPLSMPLPARIAVWCALLVSIIMPFVVWTWSRPTAFAVHGGELEIIWPARRRTVPLRGLRSVEIVERSDFRNRYGRARRVGVGGLWGGFGSAIIKDETFHLYASRSDRFVLLRPAEGNAWVLTPAQAEQFVEAVKRAG